MSSPSAPLLEVTDATVSLVPGADTLESVSLSVDPGQIVAVVGANGAGKSTLLRAISGLVSMKSGSVALDGTDLTGQGIGARVRQGLAHVPEGRRLFPEMTVDENVRMGGYLRPRREVAAAVDDLRERFPVLAERATQRAGTLSGGEQQLVAIARSLVARPRMLMLDEPSIGLAPRIVSEIGGVVRSLAEEDGIGVLLVEQNVHMAFDLASYVCVLDLGKVKASGTTESIASSRYLKESYLSG